MRHASVGRRGRPHVVVIAPVHSYDDIRVFRKEALTLAANGYRVTLLARIRRRQRIEGVSVFPVPAPSRRLHRFLALPAILPMALRHGGDVYHLHNPDTLPIAVGLRLLRRRVVYDTHEDFGQRIRQRSWMPVWLRGPVARLVSLGEAIVGRIVNVSIATQPQVCRRLGGTSILLENPPIIAGRLIDDAFVRAKELPADADGLRLVYVGLVNRARGLFIMLDALARANRRVSCRLWLIGPLSGDELDVATAHPAWMYVDYLGRLPQAQAFAHIIRADVGLVTILDVADHRTSSPNKLFEYLTFSVPFIASDFPAWRAKLAGTEAGIFVPPGAPEELAAAIVWCAENRDQCVRRGHAGRDFLTAYNWEIESEKLTRSYARLLGHDE